MLELTQRQEQIIKAGIQIVGEGGLQGFSIRKLADRVGISEPGIYRHFKNKADIVMNIGLFMVDSWQEVANWVDKLPGIEAMEKFHRDIVEFLSKNPDIAEAFCYLKTSKNHTHLFEKAPPHGELALNLLSKFIRRGQEEENIRSDIPCEHLAIVVVGALSWLMEKWRLSERDFDLATEWEPLWNALKKMITPPE